MYELEDAVDSLIDNIVESDEYKEYKRARIALNQQPGLKEKVDEFRKRNFELQRSQLDSYRLMEELDRFERENEEFRSNPLVYSFLEKELAFIRMMQEIYSSIMEGIQFE